MNEYFPEPKASIKGRKLNKIDIIMQQKQNSKMREVTAKIFDLANLISDVDKLDIDKLKHVQNNLSNLKSKLNKLDVDKLIPVSADLSKLSDVVNNKKLCC